ncbi:hypothetical protein COO16_03860 [Bacillus pseudomycoides]|uniref:ParM/StbA family protein n=1 Tax=Bacillus pseudomycoides TaxID=64104 RepID=UPI000BED7A81|nr:hypothetical protein [Bacillus pseudomycoides]PDY14106.1 hypothetical protein COO16_03860 [Bacillus pseudomycoides]
MTTLTTFAIDLGNGFVKATSKNRNKPLVAPSSIAKEKDMLRSSTNISKQNQVQSEDAPKFKVFESVTQKGTDYIWGEDLKEVVASNKLISSFTVDKRYKSENYQLLVDFVLGELAYDFKEKNLNVRVVTGMPSEELGTQDQKDLETVFAGTHVVTVNGVEKIITVDHVEVLEQPLGTLFSQLINENLEISADFTKRIAIYDFGAGTTILDVFEGGKRDEDESQTLSNGMNKIYQKVRNKIKIKTLTVHDIEDAFKNNYNFTIGPKTHNCQEHAEVAIKDFLDRALSTFQGVLTTRSHIEKIYITGGGQNIVKAPLSSYFDEEEDVTYVKNSQTASVEGFFKYGEVMNTWDDEE